MSVLRTRLLTGLVRAHGRMQLLPQQQSPGHADGCVTRTDVANTC